MEKKHKELLAALECCRKQALELVAGGCAVSGVLRGVDEAIHATKARLRYYAQRPPKRQNAPEKKKA